jgi:hypothetical protein
MVKPIPKKEIVMKKNLLFVLCLVIVGLLCATAYADPARSTAALLGDAFYALEGNALLRWVPDGDPGVALTLPRDFDPSQIDGMFAWQDTLWGIDHETGALIQFDLENQSVQTPTLKLDWPDLYYENDHTYLKTGYEQVYNLFTLGDALYLLHGNTPEYGHEYEYSLLSFDLISGARHTYEIGAWGDFYFDMCVTPYTEGKLLMASLSAIGEDDMRLKVLDIASGEITRLWRTMQESPFWCDSLAGLIYDPHTDTILVADEHLLYRMQGNDVDAVGYIPVTTGNTMSGFLLPDHRYALDTGASWYATAQPPLSVYDWSAHPLELSEALRLEPSFFHYGDSVSPYALAHPDQMLLATEASWWDAEELMELLRLGLEPADVLEIDMQDIAVLGTQGILADLQHEPWVAEYLHSLPANVRDKLAGPNGEVWGVLATLETYVWSADPELWESTGLLDEPPATWTEWIDLMVTWEAAPAAHPGLKLWDDYFSEYDPLIEDVLWDYVRRYQAEDGSVDFSSPILRDALEKLNSLPRWREISATLSDEERKATQAYGREELIEEQLCVYANGAWQVTLGPFVDPATAKRVILPPPTFVAGETVSASTSGTLWCAWADSPRLSQAIEYLRFQYESNGVPTSHQWPATTFDVSLDTLLDMGRVPDDLAALAYSVVGIPNNANTATDAPLRQYYDRKIDVDTLLTTLQTNLDEALDAHILSPR